jgi:hypothetical protein
VLKDWSFVALDKEKPVKNLGFRLIGALVAHPSLQKGSLGQDWFSTEIKSIKSDCVVVSSNDSIYRLEGPAVPEQRKAGNRLAAIMKPFCGMTWPANATKLFQEVSECLNPRRSVPIGEAGRPDETEEVVSRRFPKRQRGTVFLQKEATPETSSGVVRKGRPDVPEKMVSMRFTKRPRGTDVLQKEATPETSSGVGGDDLFLDKQISQDLNRAPKDELFRLLRVKGHTPFQRSIRPGNILVECSTCHGSCRSSHYRRDAWHVTVISEALESRCIHAQPSSDSDAKPVKRLPIGRPPTNNPPGMVVVFGGV